MNRLRQTVFISLAMVMTLQLAVAAGQENPSISKSSRNDAVAMVNGKPIKRAFAEAMAKDRASPGKLPDEAAEEIIVNQLIGNELFVHEAIKRGLDKDPEVTIKAEMVRRDLLANAFSQAYLKEHPVGDEAVRKEYERRKALLLGALEYSVRHILVLDRTVAQKIIEQLSEGADFATLAKEKSLDEGGSKDHGGDLGWISIEGGEKALIDAVADLKKGAYATEPVQTRFGWHVVKLDDVRDLQILPFDAVKERLRQYVQQKKLENLEQELRASAIVSKSANR